MNGGKVTKWFRIDDAEKFRLRDIDPADTCGMSLEKREAKEMLAAGVKRLSELQERLYAQDCWAVLIIFQAMDAAGKDSAIAHVMSGVNPQGCQVFSFKAPTPQELDHDFLWRTTLCLPERGRIGIFNRSYYEEVLVVRAHPEILARQKLPPQLVTKDIWDQRFKDIRAFERHLARSGTLILKFFLHVSKEEQRRRFLQRIDDPSKNWKFSSSDVVERKLWDTYMNAYEDMIRNTSRSYAHWYAVPADNKWFTRIVVAGAIIEALEKLDLHFPNLDSAGLAELKRARAELLAEDKGRGNNKR
jgi:PPK2 family polyphosphate:nucleotide phosphotransferase